MVDRKCALHNRENTLIQQLGLLILPLLTIEESQIVKCRSSIRKICIHSIFINRENTLIQQLGLLILPLLTIEESQIVENSNNLGGVGFRFPFPNRMRILIEL